MLELQGLSRRFGDVVALDDVTLTVEPGRLTGFLGPNGAGKTTAMRIVMGITAPNSGRVLWRGGPITRTERRRFGYMPEERGLYPKMPVRDQLIYLARLHRVDRATAARQADRWIEAVGLTDRAADDVQDLSLGNQQRVQLAAALVHDPELLVLDEPFSGLDPLAVDVMGRVLQDLSDAGVPVLFSSHQLDLVEDLCEAVAIVRDGQIVLAGDVRDLRRAGRSRLRIGLDAPPGWIQSLEGIEVADVTPDGVAVLLLADGTDPQSVLAGAQRLGTLTHFGYDDPSLIELFRDAVADQEVAV